MKSITAITIRLTTMRSLPLKIRLSALTAMLAGILAIAPGVAQAQIGVSSFSTSVSNTQAGAHADVTTSFSLATDALGNPVDQAKDVQLDLPSGLVGNPQAIPKCTDRDFQNFNCPNDAQIGILNATFITTPGRATSLTSDVPTPTTVTADITPGNKETVQVASTAGINVGDYLQFGSGATDDTEVVSAVVDATHLAFLYDNDTFNNAHAAGTVVSERTINVASTNGFEGYAGGNNIIVGSGANAEPDTVEYAPGDPTHLILNAPLTKPHTAGEPVLSLAATASAPIPLFNLQPDPGHVATLAASLLNATILIDVDVRNDGTYGLRATLSDLSTALQLESSTITLWGVPGDPSHDSQRCGELANSCRPSSVSTAAFMTNPTNCPGTPLTTTISVDSWQNPGAFVTAQASEAAPTGCGNLSFSPTMSVTPDNTQPDTPAGYDVNLTNPQSSDPYALGTPDVQKVTVVLPAGTAINPAAANGLQGCSDAQFAAASCPDASKVGTVSIKTPLLPDQLTGSVWIGSPTATQLYRVFATATADNVTINLSGNINADGSSGQLTAVFDNNPQLPFSNLNLHLFGGPFAVLANPESCGTFTSNTDISAYGAPQVADATSSSAFGISGCSTPTAFAPSFTAGTTSPVAGAFSPFNLTFSRGDSDQELSNITATLPPGLFAKIAGVEQCSNSDASAGTCPAGSQVGTATVGAGAGSHPLFLTGQVFLTGGYKGGAYGLSTVVPAVAGPYNLGTVVVRQSLQIDSNDAHVTAVSDPFPTILQGTPLRIKTINLSLNRPGFIINPTSCAPFNIAATISSVGGATAAVSSPFQVGDCGLLAFTPKLGIKLSGKGQTTDGKHPTLTANLSAPSSGQANLQTAKVTLPLSLALDPKNTTVVCSVAAAAAISCPSNTIVGTASAVSPLLPDPLNGNVYLVQGIRTNKQGQQIKTLPSLLIPLTGDISLNLRAQTSVDGAGRLVTTFDSIPDAAVSQFGLTIAGGKHGILVVTHGQNICKKAQNSTYVLGAHSGKSETVTTKLGTPCSSKKKSVRHKRSARK